MSPSIEYTEMRVHRLVLDPNTRSPIVILQDEHTGWLLPIWIGIFEAYSIAVKMEGVDPPRPMTHDLLRNTINQMKAQVARIEVTDLVDSTYLARIHLQIADKRYTVDSRPSDAIALALRAVSPIFVANHVLERSKIDPDTLGLSEEESSPTESVSEEERWTHILKGLKPPADPKKLN